MADEQQLKTKYQSVIDFIKQEPGAQLQNIHMDGGKLTVRATVPSDPAKNRVWDQIKMVDPEILRSGRRHNFARESRCAGSFSR